MLQPLPAPPLAARRPVTTTHHGRTRVDEYEWLRDKDDPEVLAHLEAENEHTQAVTAHLADLRQSIFDEIKARTRETDLSVPVRSRGYWYYGRSFKGREYGASCRVPVADPADWSPPRPDEDCAPDQPALPGEEVLLDLDQLAEGHDFFSLGGSAVSPSTRLIAYATVDETWRPDKVWRHRLGTDQADDELVHHETDPGFWTGVGRTRSDRFVQVVSSSKITSEVRLLDTESDDGGFWVFAERSDGVEYGVEHAVLGGEDVLLVLHNRTGPDCEIGVAPVAPTAADDWRPLVAHDPAVRLEDVDAFAGHLVIHQRSAGLTQLRLLTLDEQGVADDYLVEFDQEIYTVGSSGNPDFDAPVVRLGYASMTVPASIYDYDVAARELTLLRRTPVLGGYDPADYEEHRLWATADDGEQVPISFVCRRGATADGPIPVLLYGYGAYETSMDPYFAIARLSLLDRGAGFAIAHVRGGGEMGRRWYDSGKLLHKRATFTDFVACARHLVAAGLTRPDVLVAEGASAGGLLAGAVANLAPDAFGGVVAGVPFVDNLTTMLDASLPLTVIEYDEWGNPAADAETYDYIASYAPYDNVAAVDYPPILAECSLHDTRVLYVEAAKWVARLRATATGRGHVLLRTEMAAGHGGVSGRYKSWHDRAFTLAWVLDRMGLA